MTQLQMAYVIGGLLGAAIGVIAGQFVTINLRKRAK